jgi:hypothetical protein
MILTCEVEGKADAYRTWRRRIRGLVFNIVPYQGLVKGSGTGGRNLVRISNEDERLFYFGLDCLISLKNVPEKNA